MITIGVTILPNKDLLDVQGRAIADVLHKQGLAVKDCRAGKYIQIVLNTQSPSAAKRQAHKMAKDVLCNPLVESYTIKILSSRTSK